MHEHGTPPATSQSEIAALLHTVEQRDDRHHAFGEVGAIAAGLQLPGYVYFGPGGHEIASRDTLADNRLHRSEEEQQEVEFRQGLVDRFGDYDNAVTEVASRLGDHQELEYEEQEAYYKTLPGYLGAGSFAATFKIEVDGKPYAVRFMRKGSNAAVDNYIRRMHMGTAVDHVEQLTALSFDKGVIVSEFIAGKPSVRMDIEDLQTIPDNHLEQFFDLIDNVEDAGIQIDTAYGNLLYDDEAGFGLVDYAVPSNQKDLYHDHPTVALIAMMTGYTDRSKTYPSEFTDEYVQAAEWIERFLPVLDRLRVVAADRVQQGRRDHVEDIEALELYLREKVTDLRDEEQVAETISRYAANRQKYLEYYQRQLSQGGQFLDFEEKQWLAQKIQKLLSPAHAGDELPVVFGRNF